MDEIIAALEQLKISNHYDNIGGSAAPSLDNLEASFSQSPFPDLIARSRPQPAAPARPQHRETDVGTQLWELDEQLTNHMKSVLLIMDALSSPNGDARNTFLANLENEQLWLKHFGVNLGGLKLQEEAHIVHATAMQDRLSEFKASIDLYSDVLRERTESLPTAKEYNTGKFTDIAISRMAHSYLQIDFSRQVSEGSILRPWLRSLRLSPRTYSGPPLANGRISNYSALSCSGRNCSTTAITPCPTETNVFIQISPLTSERLLNT